MKEIDPIKERNPYDVWIEEATDIYRRNVNPEATVDYVEDVYEGHWNSPEDYAGEMFDETLLDDDETMEEYTKRMFEEELYFFEGVVFERYLFR